jgi:hypothetical protein
MDGERFQAVTFLSRRAAAQATLRNGPHDRGDHQVRDHDGENPVRESGAG